MDHFPAIWGWTDSYAEDDGWEEVAQRCRERGRVYTQTVYPDYYTSKVYTAERPHRMFHRYADALQAWDDGVERHYEVCQLSTLYRQLLERAVNLDAEIINIATWNDYAEGHHLAPEINHNFGFAVLLHHYRAIWRDEQSTLPDDVAVVFFKQYAHDVQPTQHAVPCRVLRALGTEAEEDIIQAVTILKSPAQLVVNGQEVQAGAGLSVHSFPIRPGQVTVRVERDGEAVLTFQAPMSITETPSRTDRLTRAYSSEFNRYFSLLYGDRQPRHEPHLLHLNPLP